MPRKLDELYFEVGAKVDQYHKGMETVRADAEKAGKALHVAEVRAEKTAAAVQKLERAGVAGKEIDKARRAAELAARDFEKLEAASIDAAAALNKSEAGAARFAKFGGGAMVAAAGAIGAAMIAVIAKATDMAQALDASTRLIGAQVPVLGRNLEGLKNVISDVSRETGASLTDLSAVGLVIAQNGVTSLEDFADRLRIVEQVSKVSGAGMTQVAEGLDQVLDSFALGADQAETVAAKLFTISRGKVPLDDLFRALEQAAPKLRTLGLGFEVSAKALEQLINGPNANPRQAAADFKRMADDGEAGAAMLRSLAAASDNTADPMKALADALALVRDGVDDEQQRAVAAYTASLERFGRAFLPIKKFIIDAAMALLDFVTLSDRLGNAGPGSGYNPLDPGNRRNQFADVRSGSSSRSTGPAPKPIKPPPPKPPPPKPSGTGTASRDQAAAAIADLQRDLAAAQAALDGPFARTLAEIEAKIAAVIAKTPGMTAAQRDQVKALGEQLTQVAKLNRATEQLGTVTPRVAEGVLQVRTEIVDTVVATEELSDGVKAVNDEFNRLTDVSATMGTLGDYAYTAANGAYNLRAELERTGALSGELHDVLVTIEQMATAAGRFADLSKSIADFKLGTGSALGVVGAGVAAATTIVGVLGGIFGKSAEDKERDALTIEQTAAIKRLTDAITNFADITISGAKFKLVGGAGAAIDDATRRLAASPGTIRNSAAGRSQFIADELAKLGLTIADIRQAAADANIPLAEGVLTFEDIQAVIEGINASEFNRYLDTFAGQLDRLTRGFAVFGTGAASQFEQVIDFLTNPTTGAPAIFGALDGIDVSTVEGLAQATEILRGIFANFENFDAGDFGGLNPSEFFAVIDLILGLLGGIQDAGTQFADAFAKIEEGFRVFDNATAGDRARTYIATLASVDSRFADMIEGLDLNTAEGLASAQERFRAFYRAIQMGIITLDEDTMAAFLTTIDAIGLAIDDLATSVLSFVGQLSALAREFDALGITDPAAQFAIIVSRLGDLGPAFLSLLDGIDLATIEGLQELDRRLGQLFLNPGDVNTDDILAFQDAVRGVISGMLSGAEAAENTMRQQAADDARFRDEQLRQAEAARQANFAIGDRALGHLQDEFALFDIDNVVEQVRQLGEVAKRGAPVFQQLLGGSDLTDPNGRADVLAKLQEFFLANPQGVESGNFDADTVRQTVLDLAEAIKDANAVDVTGGSGSFAIDRSITEVTGSRLGGLLASQLAVEQLSLVELQAIKALLTPIPFAGIAVPALPGAPAGSAGGSTTLIQLIVNGTASATTLSPELTALVRQVSEGVAREFLLAGQGA